MQIKKEDIEERLKEFSNIDKISRYLSKKEKEILFKISLQFAIDTINYEEAGNKALGCNVAQSIVRNYLMALLTGNAIKFLYKNGIKKPIILEMGTGSGLNAVSAFYMNKKSYYIGFENNDKCIKFACEQFIRFNMQKNVEIIKGDYENIKIDKIADIIINENLAPNFVEEPQIIAGNKALNYSHKKTIFIPEKIMLYGLINNTRQYHQEISFKKKNPFKIRYTEKLKNQKNSFFPGYDILDFEGNIALSQKKADDFISHLPVIGEKIIIQKDNRDKIDIILDSKEKIIIIE